MLNEAYFLDTNIVIDFFADRKPFSTNAAKIFNFSLSGKAKIYISAISYNNIYYIIRKFQTNAEALALLNELAELAEIIDVTKSIIGKALKSNFKDFEDAIQYCCALSVVNIDFIVTRDTKDFKESTLPVMAPEEAVSLLENISE